MKSIFLNKDGLQTIIGKLSFVSIAHTHTRALQATHMNPILELLRQCERMVEWKDKETSKLGFDYVKREIVKCLGALCYQDKKIQDEVRGSEGEKGSTDSWHSFTN